MRKLIYAMSLSLDGFIETGDRDLSWSNPDEELHRHFNEMDRTNDAALYGRRLYETMASFWPTVDIHDAALPDYVIEYAQTWMKLPKIVFSTTLTHVDWNSRLVKENIGAEVQRLKELPGKSMNVGGAGLAASLTELGLIDEYWLYFHPVALGSGRPFFGSPTSHLELKLIDTYTFGSGVVQLKYERKR